VQTVSTGISPVKEEKPPIPFPFFRVPPGAGGFRRAGWYNTFVAPPVIVSASRRTDLPAFHAEWFSACLSRGTAEYRNPYSGRPATVSLSRDRVAAFVFWTRDPRPFLPVLSRIEREGYRSVFHFTVTGFPREIEPFVPPFAETVTAFRRLADSLGPRRVLWRFDPLLPGEDPDGLVARFERVSEALDGLSTRCTMSIAHPYRKSLRATRHLPGIWEASGGLRSSVERIAALGRERGFEMLSCCTPLFAGWGIPPGACVDAGYLMDLFPDAGIPPPPSPVRPGCLCRSSRDIGTYRTCRHGCLYCYAA
jgi:Domain of unknown function (DUF1848)